MSKGAIAVQELGDCAFNRLKQCAELFNMESSQYAKAVLYKELGLLEEPVDQRRRRWLNKYRELDEESVQDRS